MKVLLLADAASSHTRKWSVALAQRGFSVAVFSLNHTDTGWAKQHNILIFFGTVNKNSSSLLLSKLMYILALPALKKTIKSFNPDIVHAHYATSYGMLGSFTRFRPLFISAWGSDVLKFPQKSIFHKLLLKWNLARSEKIFASSYFLKNALANVTDKKVIVIPFGVDTNVFAPNQSLSIFPEGYRVIGIIKSLEPVYRIDLAIEAFSLVKQKFADPHFKLLIVGGGSLQNKLKEKVEGLKLRDDVIFTGKINHSDIVKYHNSIDIYLNVSDYESFGVSILEASSCGKPVIATDTGGVSEVVEDSKTGFLIKRNQAVLLAEKIIELLNNPKMAKEMGENGRMFVKQNFEWNQCVSNLIKEYNISM